MCRATPCFDAKREYMQLLKPRSAITCMAGVRHMQLSLVRATHTMAQRCMGSAAAAPRVHTARVPFSYTAPTRTRTSHARTRGARTQQRPPACAAPAPYLCTQPHTRGGGGRGPAASCRGGRLTRACGAHTVAPPHAPKQRAQAHTPDLSRCQPDMRCGASDGGACGEGQRTHHATAGTRRGAAWWGNSTGLLGSHLAWLCAGMCNAARACLLACLLAARAARRDTRAPKQFSHTHTHRRWGPLTYGPS
jgi:hypothetical protein